jgi:hypothetical protein
LQNAQQLDLDVGRNLADLVEKQGAAIGLQKAAVVALDRAGEGTALVAE